MEDYWCRWLQSLIDQGIDPRHEKAERVAASEAKREQAKRVRAPAMEAWQAYLEADRRALLLLVGGDKRRQQADIATAVRYWQGWQKRNAQ